MFAAHEGQPRLGPLLHTPAGNTGDESEVCTEVAIELEIRMDDRLPI
jgi:hypothetical protein